MSGYLLRLTGACLLLFVCSTYVNAIEFRGAEYDVYLGDVNGDGIDDIYLKVPDTFVLLHGDISVPLFVDSEIPSYLVESYSGETNLYLDPVVDETIDISSLVKSEDVATLADVNGDQIEDLVFASADLLYDISIDGDENSQPKIVSVAIQVPSLSTAAIDPADDTTSDPDYYGIIPSNSFVDRNGAFNISVPLELPPGINGFSPKLSLNYNSRAQNGVLGWGWRLGGVSSIQRCNADFARDGKRSGVLNGQAYKFCLDGQRLVEVAEREYRLERDNFSRIKSVGGEPSNPDYWTVEFPNGATSTYGNTQDSVQYVERGFRFYYQSNHKWHLNLMENSFGNEIRYQYDVREMEEVGAENYNSGGGRLHRLDKITYGFNGSVDLGLSIRFDYELRHDVREYYVAGEHIIEHERLESIYIQKDEQSYLAYLFDYDAPASGNVPSVSKLNSIRKCSIESQTIDNCSAEKRLTWQQDSDPEELLHTSRDDRPYYGVGDFNGDGKLETLKVSRASGDEIVEIVSTLDGSTETWLREDAGDIELSVRPTIVDINGDGLDDVAFLDQEREYGHRYSFRALISNGSSFSYWDFGNPSSDFDTTVSLTKQLLDVNGDGFLDFVVKHYSLGVQVRLNTGGSTDTNLFGEWEEWFPPYDRDWDRLSIYNSDVQEGGFYDLNGDGLVDYIFCAKWDGAGRCGVSGSGVNSTYVFENTGSSFRLETEKWKTEYSRSRHVKVADMNGDGLVDWIFFDSPDMNVQLNNGQGFEAPASWMPISHYDYGAKITVYSGSGGSGSLFEFHINNLVFADLNMDGCADLVARKRRFRTENHDKWDAPVYVGFSTCSSLSGITQLNNFADGIEFRGNMWKSGDDNLTGSTDHLTKPWTSGAFLEDVNKEGILELADRDHVFPTNIKPRVIINESDIVSSSGTSVSVNEKAVKYDVLANSDYYSGSTEIDNANIKNREGGAFTGAYKKTSVNIIAYEMEEFGKPLKRYQYKNSLYDASGWGSLGFETVTQFTYPEIESLADGESLPITADYIKSETKYLQDISNDARLAGLVDEARVYAYQGDSATEQLISQTKNYWRVRTYNDDIDAAQFETISSPHFLPYLAESLTERWDLSGASLGMSKNGVASVVSANCSKPINFRPEKIIAGATNDVDFSAFGINLHTYSVACDESGSSASAVFESKKVANYQEMISDSSWYPALVERVESSSYVGVASESANFETSALTRTISYGYDNGIPVSETVEPDSNALRLATSYAYNAFGTKDRTTQSWVSQNLDGLPYGNSRYSEVNEVYDASGVLTQTFENMLRQSSSASVEPKFGNTLQSTDINNITTSFAYDDYGRVENESNSTGISTNYQYKSCNQCFSYNSSAVYYVSSKTTGQSAIRTYYDAQDREVGTRTRSLNGDFIYTYKSYDFRGKVVVSSQPFYASSSPIVTEFYFDLLGRPELTVYPDTTESSISYSGLQTTIVNREGQAQKVSKNIAGWDVQVEDNAGTKIDFTYDAFGNLETTRVNEDAATLVTIGYDLLGRRTSLDDPNAGYIEYDINPLGLLVSETDANQITTYYEYDELDRVITRTDDFGGATELSHSWVYDNKPNGTGSLGSVVGYDSEGNTYKEEYQYNSDGYQDEYSVEIAGVSYTTATHYDDLNRVKGITYPSGFTYQNEYNSYGYLDRVEKLDGSMLWQLSALDALGNHTQYSYGNGVTTNQSFVPESGFVETITASGNGFTVMNHQYGFSPLGNLEFRTDHRFGITESFCYDNMNRLTAARFNGCSNVDSDFAYDDLGNITEKDGISDYAYGSGRPHAVSQFGGSQYEYDSSGQMISGGGKTISYTTFGKPSYMSKGNNWTAVTYDANKNRINRSDSSGRNTTYIGLGGYEINRDSAGTQLVHYIGDFAKYVIETGSINDDFLVYMHRDHIGSIVAESGEYSSQVQFSSEWQGFSAWGERLSQTWNGNELGESFVPMIHSRGFTDHEHLDGVGLIHMNGRVYDPELGRFLTPDPFVQAPNNTQSYNRYTYVFNNPLSFVDPSGYNAENLEVQIVIGTPPPVPTINDFNFNTSQIADMGVHQSFANFASSVQFASNGTIGSTRCGNSICGMFRQAFIDAGQGGKTSEEFIEDVGEAAAKELAINALSFGGAGLVGGVIVRAGGKLVWLSSSKSFRLVFDPSKKIWVSSAGLIYGVGSKHGNRIKHVLAHASPNSKKKVHTVFNVERKNVLSLIDEAWLKKGASVPGDPGAFVVPMGRVIGSNGETSIKIIVNKNSSEVITAYPLPL
ncbi:MAG: FG-GAP-like repeat-containing protein [Agarilytica sp.]